MAAHGLPLNNDSGISFAAVQCDNPRNLGETVRKQRTPYSGDALAFPKADGLGSDGLYA